MTHHVERTDHRGSGRLLSIVVPALNEAPSATQLLDRVREIGEMFPDDRVELIVVDDGSTDGTADAVLAAATDADDVTVVELARNFGSHYASSAGFAEANGDCAILLGADLQEPLTLVSRFIEEWEQGADVVWGVRETRTGNSLSYTLMSKSFSRLFSRHANLSNYPPEGPSGALVDRKVLDVVVAMGEHNRNVLAMIAWSGFTQTRVGYEQLDRAHGESRWTRRKSAALALDSMVQFSSLPLRVSAFAGAITAAVGGIYALVLLIRAVVGIDTPTGWPTLTVIVLLIGGLQLVMLGVIGEYLWRVADESRGRPLFVVRRVSRHRAGLDTDTATTANIDTAAAGTADPVLQREDI